MAFDPDAFLAEPVSNLVSEFDPDAFISGVEPVQPDNRTAADIDKIRRAREAELPELSGILAGQDPLKVAALTPVLLATTDPLEFGNILIVVTVLINSNDLLVKPLHDGFQVFHQNSRFSLNRKDVKYSFEAYG